MQFRDAMGLALAQAERAARLGEVPVGAVLLRGDDVVAAAYNGRERLRDPTAHAEMRVLRRGGRRLGNWRLTGCTLVVTLEPCPMCTAAIAAARVRRVVFGARDPLYGAMESRPIPLPDPLPEVIGGIREEEARAMLESLFRSLRGRGGVSEPG